MKTTTPDPRARSDPRRVRFADEKGEREDAWIVDDDSESTTTATRARSSANERDECVESVESVSRVPSPTTTPRAKVGESTSSAVKDRVAAFERAASDVDEESRAARAATPTQVEKVVKVVSRVESFKGGAEGWGERA